MLVFDFLNYSNYGIKEFEILSAEKKISKYNTPQIELRLKIFLGNHESAVCRDWISNQQVANTLCDSIETYDIDDFVGKRGKAFVCKDGKYYAVCYYGDIEPSDWDYNLYLKSTHWRNIRRQKLKQTHSCAGCGIDSDLQVHHKHYKTIGHEGLDDLTIFCDDCHRKLSQRGNKEYVTE